MPQAGHCFRQQALETCPELSRSDTEGRQGNLLETIRQMVASGLGITVMSSSALTPTYQHKRLIAIKLAEPVLGRRIGLAWRRGYTRPSGDYGPAGNRTILKDFWTPHGSRYNQHQWLLVLLVAREGFC